MARVYRDSHVQSKSYHLWPIFTWRPSLAAEPSLFFLFFFFSTVLTESNAPSASLRNSTNNL
jgi:hypothetical protein